MSTEQEGTTPARQGADEQFQHQVAKLLLEQTSDAGFALAGAGAVRAHGLTARPTQDIDLFSTSTIDVQAFKHAVQRSHQSLLRAGYGVEVIRDFETFARFHITEPGTEEQGAGSRSVEVDFAVNWRADPTVVMEVGPVLSERDAVAGKLSALYSRAEIRDFLDVDAIRVSGRYTDEELLGLSRDHDEGFDTPVFAAQLSLVVNFEAEEAAEYGISAEEFALIQQRTYTWAQHLRDNPAPELPEQAPQRARSIKPIDPFADPFGHPGPRSPGHQPPGRSL